jgi:hypothetical protein
MPVIPIRRRPRQEDFEFKVSLGFIVRSCFRKKNTKKLYLGMELGGFPI